MPASRSLALVLCALTLAACSRGRGAAAPTATAPAAVAPPAAPLAATLQPVNSPVTAQLMLRPGGTAQEIRATLQLRNSAAGLVHRWAVRPGSCAAPSGDVVGTIESYGTLAVNADGTATVETVLPFGMPVGAHHAVVLRSRTDDTVIACGGLAPAV